MADSEIPLQLNSMHGKKALALVRKADYAHPGDTETVDLVFKRLPQDPSQRVLDVGSGLGVTADYIRRQGWGKVTGIELSHSNVIHANQAYKRCDFVHADVIDAPLVLKPGFDVLVSFNAFFQFPDQAAALRALSQVARPDSQLAIVDFVDRGDYHQHPILENDRPLLPNPLHLERVEKLLADNGWRLFTIEPLHPMFVEWYRQLVERIDEAEAKIREVTPDGFFEHLRDIYAQLREAMNENRLGGAIVRAVHGKAQ